MKDMLVYILNNILEENNVDVKEEEKDGFTVLEIHAPKEQIGRIIGKNGKIINSIKNVLKVKAIKENKRIDIQIVEKE